MADYLSVVYDEASHPYTDYPSKLASYLFQAFGMRQGMKLLEAGCGRGEALASYKNLGLEVTGMDRSEESASQLAKHGIEFVNCDFSKDGQLPIADNSFDIVYSKSFLEHLENPDAFMREAYRILKPDGLLLCLVPDWESNYKIYFDDFTHRTPFSRVSLSDILLMCDFSDIFVYRMRQLPIVWKYPMLNYLCWAISPFVPVRTQNKFLRWSRELMLVGSGRKRID